MENGLEAQRPVVSILMPTLNCGRFVSEALASVAAAAEDIPHEIVVADGGSTDGTADHLRARSDIRLLEGPDGGIYDGLNKALSAAHGRFVLFLNGDDLLAARAVAGLAKAAFGAGADLVTGDADVVSEAKLRLTIRNGDCRMSAASVLFGIPAINARMFSREMLLSLGGFSLAVGLASDRELLFRLTGMPIRRARCIGTTYIYRSHPGSATLAGTTRSRQNVHRANLALSQYLESRAAEAAERRLAGELACWSRLGLLRSGGGLGAERGRPFLSRIGRTAGALLRFCRWRGRGAGW